MKRFTSVLLSVLLILSLVSPGLAAPISSQITTTPSSDMNFSGFSKTAGFHFDFEPAGSIWRNLIAGQTPARLQATYTLKEDVVKVGADFDKNIKAASQLLLGSSIANTPAMRIVSNGAFISKSVLESASGATQPVQPDTVFVNESTGTAFKVVVAMDGDEGYEACKDHYAVTQPQIHEVVEDFALPRSDVALNQANITSFSGLPGGTSDSVENYIVNSGLVVPFSSRASDLSLRYIDDPLIEFAFPEGTELKATAGGQNITVKVSGGLGIGNLGLEAKYSGFDGYYFALKIAEEAYLNVDVGISTNQEIRIPILGIDVPFGIGRVSGGLFVVVGLDGEVTIQMEAREYIASKMGVKGDTFLYAPVSCKPFFSMPEKSFDGDVQVDGKINGYVKAGALLSLEIFGWDLVGAGVFIGSGVNITSLDGMLDIELYGLVQVYITFAGDTYYLLHFKPTLLRKQQKDMGGYRATIEEVCAYQDIVVGYLQKSVTQGGNIVLVNAGNTMFDIEVTDPNTGTTTYYPKNNNFYYTDPDGRFLVRDFPDMDLHVNDQVGIRVYEGQTRFGPSKPVPATYPFRRISITAADAFNDWIEGQVEPARVRNWDKKPGEEDYEMLRFTGEVGIDIQTENNQNYLRETLYTVHVTTDENGFFRAENGRLKAGDPFLDFQNANRFTAFIDQDEALVHAKSYLSPYTRFALKTIAETVPGSSVRFMEGSDTIDQVRVKTRIYVINMGGSRQLTGLETTVALHGLSTQDRGTNGYWAYDMNGEMMYYGTGDGKTVNNASHDMVFKTSPSIPIEAGSSIQLLNDQTNGTSYVDLMLVKEWVWPAHSNPTVITSPDHTECTTEGGEFQVTATGEEIILFVVTPSIPGVVLAKDGRMTMAPGMSPGIYQMTIEATANHSDSPMTIPDIVLPGTPYEYTEDSYPPVYQAFTLTVIEPEEPSPTVNPVSPPPTLPITPASPTPSPTVTPSPAPTPVPVPPTITSARSVTVYRPSGGSFQVTADGTLPITYSLAPLPDYPDMPVPEGVTIDENTGLLSVAGWVAAGTHYFSIIATNTAGQDQQTFMLVVKNLFATIPRISAALPGSQPNSALKSSDVVSFSANLPPVIQPGAGDWIANLTDAPEYVLRNDDPKDLYSQDMLYISGAEYVKYDLLITFTAEEELYAIREFDTSPCNNHHAIPMTEEEKQAIEDTFKNRKLLIEYERFGPDLESRLDRFLVDQWTDISVLDYGSVIRAIDGLKSGTLSIGLGGAIGTMIPGSVFNALQDKSSDDIGLRFGQEGATMTFMSGTVKPVEDNLRFDLAFSHQAVSTSAMMEVARGGDSFSFAFAHNDILPGYAQFDIETDLAAGQSVNVYRYDAETRRFSTIAENIIVAEGGVVTYMNNSMSEYLITTTRLEGTETTEAFRVNNHDRVSTSFPWVYFAGGGVLLVLMTGGLFLLMRNRKKRAGTSGEPSL